MSRRNVQFEELIDYHALRLVVKNFQALGIVDEQTMTMVKNYCEKACPVSTDPTRATVPVTYQFAQGTTSGRLFANGGLSLQSMSHRVRHTLAKNTYSDYDMVNAHPTILSQYCSKHGLWHTPLKTGTDLPR